MLVLSFYNLHTNLYILHLTFFESHMGIIAKKIHVAFHRCLLSSSKVLVVQYIPFTVSHLLQKDYEVHKYYRIGNKWCATYTLLAFLYITHLDGGWSFNEMTMYSVINLILPSKQLLRHFFTNMQVDVLGDFNLEFWYILLFEVRFWIFRISFFAQNGDNSKGYPLENLKSHHLWFEKCFLITKCIKISVIKIISKLT